LTVPCQNSFCAIDFFSISGVRGGSLLAHGGAAKDWWWHTGVSQGM